MRHRKRGRVLGRSPSHRKALFKNLASALFLTERDAEFDSNAPKVKGRITTTLQKAKEVRPLVERCITIAKKAVAAEEAAREFETDAERGSEPWKAWRESDQWRKWAEARSPIVTARRRVLQLIGDPQAVSVLFDTIAERYVDRPGGYTRIVRLANVRLGDGGQQAILELVGKAERVSRAAEKPAFASDDDEDSDEPTDEPSASSDEQQPEAEVAENEKEKAGAET
ncbi:MAG: L17 family ribosomal protein [Pirellulaceae bacterium]